MQTLRYEYRPKTWVMALAGLFFAGCAIVLTQSARHNDRGMVINGLITLDTGQATAFLWVLAGLSILFVALGLYGVARSFGVAQEIVIDARSITAPTGGFSSTIVTVPFAAITDLQMRDVQSQRFLIIHHQAGKLTITRSMMPSHADFDEAVATVAKRCRAAAHTE